MKKETPILLFFLFVINSSFSQEKYEREYRVIADSVPEKAKLFVDKFKFDKKVKWYVEESQDGKTIEAKSYLNSYKYSIEFAEKGGLIDVEKQIKFKELPKSLQEKLKTSLVKKYKKFKIKKLQIQYKGSKEKVFQSIFENSKIGEVSINYELVVKAKKGNQSKSYELLIDKNGTILKELIFKNSFSINLEF